MILYSKLLRMEEQDTWRTGSGTAVLRKVFENYLIIACKTIVKDKALGMQLFFRHADSSQTCKNFYIG